MAQCGSEPASSRRPSTTSEVLQSKRTFLFPNETKEISVEHGLKALREFDGNGGDITNYGADITNYENRHLHKREYVNPV